MGQDDRLVKPEVKLQQFLETCSDQTLGDLQLSRLNDAANTGGDFQESVQKLIQAAIKLAECAEAYVQSESEARYVSFVREAAKQCREIENRTQKRSRRPKGPRLLPKVVS